MDNSEESHQAFLNFLYSRLNAALRSFYADQQKDRHACWWHANLQIELVRAIRQPVVTISCRFSEALLWKSGLLGCRDIAAKSLSLLHNCQIGLTLTSHPLACIVGTWITPATCRMIQKRIHGDWCRTTTLHGGTRLGLELPVR